MREKKAQIDAHNYVGGYAFSFLPSSGGHRPTIFEFFAQNFNQQADHGLKIYKRNIIKIK